MALVFVGIKVFVLCVEVFGMAGFTVVGSAHAVGTAVRRGAVAWSVDYVVKIGIEVWIVWHVFSGIGILVVLRVRLAPR